MQILIAEDEKRLLNVLRRGLTEEGYAVDIACEGEQALEKAGVNEYDLVILDLMLPKVDGLSVLKKSAKRIPACRCLS
jgi:DNA-binding response OmpR family regulator